MESENDGRLLYRVLDNGRQHHVRAGWGKHQALEASKSN